MIMLFDYVDEVKSMAYQNCTILKASAEYTQFGVGERNIVCNPVNLDDLGYHFNAHSEYYLKGMILVDNKFLSSYFSSHFLYGMVVIWKLEKREENIISENDHRLSF